MKVKKVKNRILWILIAVLATGVVASGGILLVKSIRNAALSGNKANVAWYNENDEEFIISTSEELYELAKLSQYYDFKDQTVKLDADIVLNEGNASDWEEKAPENMWYPITGFAGTFDGDGHTISGVYGKSLHSSMGLFTDTQKECVIKDIRLVNSYFYSVSHQGTGSIIGAGAGKLDSIYSDAKIVNHGFYTGGLIGNVNEGGEIRVTNSWFDGDIELNRENFKYISLMPCSEIVRGVTTSGLKYPLENATLLQSSSYGISNEFYNNTAKITIKEGLLFVICTAE